MGNMCCRREEYAPNGADTDPSRCSSHPQTLQQYPAKQQQQHLAMSSAYHSAGDDCAINELLEGRMDLDVLMPDGRQVRLTVERRTPMMDLLVQAASATKISPGGHVIHVFGDANKGSGSLQYKPSTPIGSLDTNTIFIVPKKEAGDLQGRKTNKTCNRPFEPTFRVQVHLPRNQLTVLRVSPRVKIAELKNMVCKEKGLDTSRYQLVRPSGPTEPLAGDMTLAEYGSTEITLLSNSSIESHICNSTSHIISYPKRTEEQKRKNGILRLLAEDANKKVSNSNSTCYTDGYQKNIFSKSADASAHQTRYKPKKRRPAPPPPPPILPEAPSHSRQSSSDSSGYHEATSSFLHEEHSSEEKSSSDSSGVSSLDAKGPSIQPSPPLHNLKKKKAPAPPAPPRQKEKLSPEIIPSGHNVSENKPISNPLAQKQPITQGKPDDHINPNRPAIHQKTDLQSNCAKKVDILSHEHHTDSKELISPTKGAILTNRTIQNSTGHTEQDNNTAKSKDLTPPNCSILQKNQTIQENQSAAKSDLIYTSNPLQENNPSGKDQVLPEDQIVRTKHVIPKDEASKQTTEEKQDFSDIHEKSDGQPQAFVSAPPKGMPSMKTSIDHAIKGEVQRVSLEKAEKSKNAARHLDGATTKETTSNRVKEETISNKGEAVSTRVALVAFNARLEQDVTQQEIASSIQAAFHALDCNVQQPSLLSIKQRGNGDSSTLSSQNSISSLSSTAESCHSVPTKAAALRAPLKEEDSIVEYPRPDVTKKYKSSEKEALLIDEEPPPRPVSTGSIPTKSLRRSSSLLNFLETTPKNTSSKNPKRSRHLQRSLSDLTSGDKEDFEAEQERLQQEYIKLQRQFILWQQQLINNHAMLREECIVPQYARTLRQSHSLPEGEDYVE